MIRFYLPLLLLILNSLNLFAQNGPTAEQLISHSQFMLNQDPKASLADAINAKTIAEKSGDEKNLAIALSLIGVAEYKMDQFDSARVFIEQATKISQQVKDTSTLAFCNYWMAFLELNKGQYVKALDLYESGYALADKANDKRNMARCLDGEASIYESLKEYDKAMEFYQKSLDIAHQANFEEWYGGVVFSMANLLNDKRQVDSAIAKYNEAIRLSQASHNLNNIGTCYHKLADIYYYKKKDSNKALEYVKQALDIFIQTGSSSAASHSRLLMATIFCDDKQYDLAIDLANVALDVGREKKEIPLEKDAAEVLYYAYKAKGDMATALVYHERFHWLSENDKENELVRELTKNELTTNFEKERQLAKANQEKLKAELERQKLAQKASFAVIILISIIAMLAILAFIEKRRDNRAIANEKRKSDQLLLNILPSEVADEMKEYGRAKPRNYDMATVLFADIKNFTQAAETMSPEKLVSEIDYYFGNFDQIIAKYKVEKIKTIGDAYLCVGGLPIADNDNAFYVLNAAIELQKFVEDTKKIREKNGDTYFEIRIGIHTGQVVAGIVGMRKFAYDIWGDTVNVAARMEQYGQEGKINISGSTYSLVKDKFSCNYRGKIEAKNKGQIDMYFFDSKIIG